MDFITASYWYSIHAAVGVVCICLPTYAPLAELVGLRRYPTFQTGNGLSARHLRSGFDGGRLGNPQILAPYYPAKDRDASSTSELVMDPMVRENQRRAVAWCEITATGAPDSTPYLAVPPGAIARTTTVDVV